MPNWCSNTITVSHEDAEQMAKFEKAMNEGNLFQTFVPLSSGEWDYGTAIEEWGTKWDIAADGNPAQDIPGGLMLGFESAWAPPCAAYEKLTEQGFRIRAMYFEPGMAFAGIWEDGIDDFYEYGGLDSAGIAEELPVELDEAFGISEDVAQWEAENAEEEENIDIDLDGGVSAVNEQEQQK